MRIPITADEARYRMRELVADMRDIENQLSNKNKLDFVGLRMRVRMYWNWNGRAKHALAQMQAEHHFLKDWLKENGDTEKILVEALLRVYQGEDVTDDDWRACIAASGYLRSIIGSTP
ncbi:MAG: hypothetical protein GQ524_01945 [Anaerolineales bacterium]|nr:hypothetical protein [Anaerolineales bacterium]